jgi:nucleotide-binding universal stress UspA family protein
MNEILYCAPGHIFCRAKKILLAVDGSEESARAATAAFEIAEMTDSKLFIVHVVPTPIVKQVMLMTDGNMDEILVKYSIKGEKLLEGVRAAAKEYNLDIELILDRGSPSERLLALTNDKGVDLIVLGSKGLSGARTGLGGASERVLLDSNVPVLVIK